MSRGYSLLECIVALGLVAVVVLLMGGLFLGGQAAGSHSLEGSRGSQVAELEITRLKGLSSAQLESHLTTPPAPRSLMIDDQSFVIHSNVERLDPSPASPEYALLRLRVRVVWQQQRQISLSEEQSQLKRVDTETGLQAVVAPEARF